MKLFNTVVVYDVYTLAETEEDAITAAVALIRDVADPLPISESVAIEIREERAIREAWLLQRPIVGSTITDSDFEKVKGKTTKDAFELLHIKPKEAVK